MSSEIFTGGTSDPLARHVVHVDMFKFIATVYEDMELVSPCWVMHNQTSARACLLHSIYGLCARLCDLDIEGMEVFSKETARNILRRADPS